MKADVRRPIDFCLYAITDRHACPTGMLPDTVSQAGRYGVRAFQLREKDMTTRDLLHCATKLQDLCRKNNLLLFVNDRTDVARLVGAAGVHLTSHRMPVKAARLCLLPEQLVGVSTHSSEEVSRAEAEGADFALFGPIFETPSKAEFGIPQGLSSLKTVVGSVKIPVFAVGGITPKRAAHCLDQGARGVAVISALMKSQQIAQTVQNFRNAMGKL